LNDFIEADNQQKPATDSYDSLALADRLVTPLLAAGEILTAVGFLMSFFTAPLVLGAAVSLPAQIGNQMVTNRLLLSQKIFYFHVPVALVSFIALGFLAWYGFRYLTRREAACDLKAKVAAEIALVFILMTMASGEMWERYEWGVWWTWEPRLTTYLILMLLVIAYFVLRAAIEDEERRATFSAVFGIFAFLDAPICLLITRMIPSSVHPVIFRTDSGLPPAMLIPFLLCLTGMLLVAFAVYRFRLREQLLRYRLDLLKAQLED